MTEQPEDKLAEQYIDRAFLLEVYASGLAVLMVRHALRGLRSSPKTISLPLLLMRQERVLSDSDVEKIVGMIADEFRSTIRRVSPFWNRKGWEALERSLADTLRKE